MYFGVFYVYICICVYVCVYIYICIERERERDLGVTMHGCIHMFVKVRVPLLSRLMCVRQHEAQGTRFFVVCVWIGGGGALSGSQTLECA